MKFEVGQKWKNRNGEFFVITGVSNDLIFTGKETNHYPISARSLSEGSHKEKSFTEEGGFLCNGDISALDLVELVDARPARHNEYEEYSQSTPCVRTTSVIEESAHKLTPSKFAIAKIEKLIEDTQLEIVNLREEREKAIARSIDILREMQDLERDAEYFLSFIDDHL
jgi:hypothetical protein